MIEWVLLLAAVVLRSRWINRCGQLTLAPQSALESTMKHLP